MSVLDAILAATRAECARLHAELPPPVDHRPIDVAARLSRARAVTDVPLRLIAEIKKRSPSAGALSRALGVEQRAAVYAREGATMISVLVDRAHFDGGYDDLSRARAVTDVPLLAKGFTIDDVQLEAARRAGADAVLLIARILDDAALRALLAGSVARGLTPIVEVVDEQELSRALAADARVIGVNARDLATLMMDRARAARVLAAIPEGRVALWFSGVSEPAEIATLRASRVDGALIGEALMRHDDPAPLLRAMIDAAGR
ncbi:MAG: indole-3-glycerol-phosphate synthase [Deltaproteobacteria bacterium]|nr:indole-3-glycerol-phosphate synthase [Deltaproteobacteria bacterium]